MVHSRRLRWWAVLLTFVTVFYVACQQDEPAGDEAQPGPTASATAIIGATATPEPAVTQTPAAEATVRTGPEPPLFDAGWDDRSLFREGLIPSERGVLDQLSGASVYHIEMAISDDLTRLEGRQAVRYTNQEDVPLDQVYFRLFPNLTGGTSRVEDVQVDGETIDAHYELMDSALLVPLPQPLDPGEQTVIEMAFDVTVPTSEGGNYGTFIYDNDVLALAHFYPLIPVYDDEGWNVEIPAESGDVVYADSSFYLVRITAPADLVMVVSGREVEVEEVDGRQEVTYAAGPARDFYIAASERYEATTRQVGETTINGYSFPQFTGASELLLEHTVASVESFNRRFGLYPYTELDVASTPTLALGVEYPGAFVITDRMVTQGSPYPPASVASTIAHETAHQWFYSTVGNDQLDEPWLDEALAQYATLQYWEDVEGPAGARGFRESLEGRWARVDFADIPIGLPVAAYSPSEYGAIVYGRGPLFLGALEERIGEESVDALLRDYYQSFRWQIATTADFHQLAETHCECELDALFNEWVYR
ncbi:MAG: M1 family metallopeptidase [Candidatus Promineifilaceae bacterium]|nr:M1 family metallopeptidase [Candidatus Promineifilaceae bacterium]